ncbi:sensor histidine kinase [Fulvivirga sp. RKSG066]|uniref:ligand-binding sensor domain-containing protein n=1 Tax=Fulvivirga aurantia TaxID=2529383 RepID=UPI0012BC9298|nr:sensor histidine kinase [Fulvivirga aurantia]MTI21270.1 sensor histidine kinase [Fulvivirga aurantia]
MTKKEICTFLILFCFVGFSYAQINNKLLFDQIFIPGEIVQNPIYDVEQGPYGLMWFAINDGILRYDGYEFETFSVNDQANKPLSDVVFYDMLFIDDSTMLVATRSKGLLKFDHHSKQFTSLLNNNSPAFFRLTKLETGEIYASAGAKGLYKVEADSIKRIVDRPIGAIKASPNNSLLFSVLNEVYELSRGNITQINKLAEGLRISSIGFNGSNIWLGTARNGLFEIGPAGVSKIYDCNSQVNAIFSDKQLNIWVLTHSEGAAIYHEGKFMKSTKELYSSHSLTSNRALSIVQDQNEIIWVGTSAGISKYDPFKTKFEIYQHNPMEASSISGNLIRGIYEDSDQHLWVATEDGAINVLDKEGNGFRSLKLKLPQVENIIPYDFLELNDKQMLVASSAGLLRAEKDLSGVSVFNRITAEALGNRARSLVPLDDDRFFILSAGQVYLYNFENGKLDKVTVNDSAPYDRQNVDDYARTIYVDKEKNVWVGSYGTVALLDIGNNSAQYFPLAENRGHMVMSMNRIGDHLWVGTFNGGLKKLNIKNGKHKDYTTAHGLPNNAIYTTIEDKNGSLWLSTNNGISKFDLQKESFENFDVSDGLQSAEFNRLAYCKLQDGRIAVGGINGLNIFHPAEIHINPHLPKSAILSAEVLNEFNENNQHPKISLLGATDLDLSYKRNFLRFNFCSTLYGTPEQNKFYYQLTNFDENWVFAGSKNSATYTGLKHGNYVFKVKSVSPDGLEEVQYAMINININAPFWMKWWFYLAAAIGLFLLSYVVVTSRMEKIRAQQYLLEQEIEERTKELKQSKQELSDLNEKKDFIFSILSHDLRAPLTTLEGFLGLLISHYEYMTEEEIKTHASAIKDSVGKSLDLIDNTLYWSLSQMGTVSFLPVDIKINELFDRVKGLYGLTAQKKNISLNFKNADGLRVRADDNMTYIILRNLVSNAIKFTPEEKQIEVSAEKQGEFVTITVKDEGVGVEESNLHLLFDQKPNLSKRGTSNEKGTGLGLVLCKKFVDLNKGSISVVNNKKGASFIVKLPAA